MENQNYINKMYYLVKTYGEVRGYDKNVFMAIVAQACLESAYGKSILAKDYHNHFGMKAGSRWKGASVNLSTKEEYVTGKLTKIKDYFRVYPCDEDGVAGYFDFISAKRYSNLKECKDPYVYIQLLKEDGWATSSAYVKNVTSVLNKIKVDDNPKEEESQDLEKIAWDVIKGKYGNGARRRAALGSLWRPVQEIVNRILNK